MNDWDFWFATGIGALERDSIDSERLLGEGRVERWGHRAVIHHREQADELYVVVQGGVEVDRDTDVRLRPGDLFGTNEQNGEPPFRAYDETTIVAVDRAHFDELVDEHGLLLSTRFRNGLKLENLAIRLPTSAIVGVGPIGRLATVIGELGRQNGESQGDATILPNLKPKHLSNLAALDRKTTGRAFDALVNASMIESPAGALVIPSLADLKRYTEDLQ